MAPVEESVEESVPAQWRPQTLYDFRGMPDGPRGYKVGVTKKGRVGSKRKLDDYSKQVRFHGAWHAHWNALSGIRHQCRHGIFYCRLNMKIKQWRKSMCQQKE